MTSQSTTLYTPFADGRTVRDIVEHSPALVKETWCRDLLRHTLDSLERQYATGAPHRPISPDTIVMLANNEPLLLPAPEEVGPAGAGTLAADLHALALVVHYAITAELPPDGPLGPRLYEDYSPTLTNGVDRCLGPNQRLRPKTVDEMRRLLGIEAPAGEQPLHPSTLAAAAPAAPALPEAPAPLEVQPAAVPDYSQPAPAAAPAPVSAPAPTPRLHTPAAADAPVNPAQAPAAEPLLRTPAAAVTTSPPPAAASTGSARPPTALEAATAARLQEEAARKRATPAAAPPVRAGSVRRWGWIAGAAIVLAAAAGALVSWLQQDDARDMVALSLPPAERAANGLEPGETIVTPAPSETDPATPGAPAAQAVDGQEAAPLPAEATDEALVASPAAPGKAGEAVVGGVTYKLLIKPWGIVYVDDVDRGVSPPVKRLTLSPGKHTVRIVNPNFPEHVRTIEAGKRGSKTIEHDFTAKAE